MESRHLQDNIDISGIEKNLLTVMGIQDVDIIEQVNPNTESQPRISTMTIQGLGVINIQLPHLNDNHFFVRITFTNPFNLAMAQRELAKHPFFNKISISKKNPLVLGAKMTKKCAEQLYDVTSNNEIDMALIDKYGGPETMKRFLYELFLRENSVPIIEA